jgi:hypothetical protein
LDGDAIDAGDTVDRWGVARDGTGNDERRGSGFADGAEQLAAAEVGHGTSREENCKRIHFISKGGQDRDGLPLVEAMSAASRVS